MILKASGIDNLTVARYFSAFDAKYFGFKPLEASFIAEVCSWLFEPSIVVELPLNCTKEDVLSYHKAIENVIVEISTSQLEIINQPTTSVKYGLKLSANANLEALKTQTLKPEYIVIDSQASFEVAELKKVFSCPILLTLAAGMEEIERRIKSDHYSGFNIIGQSETETGLLDFEATDKIMEVLVPED